MSYYKGTTGTSMNIERAPKRPKGWVEPGTEFQIEYKCPKGHTRIEPQKLIGEMPLCSNCHMTTGEMNRFAYIRKVKMAKITAKGRSKKKKK
ncbi:hypothetical protein GC098_14140 [Paenibacillus sp. LMG 31458]|uniref:Uncharacterized protein n=1 Tax=Paenibacillus phytorum TaxID=2654977 RepID=A0ABX1XVH5_9BACL|nr:hypothetical protein [Paenibacillus phytorum]NOU72553.1 hypothetical protein [Paenibacillus phytorum]